MFLQNPLGSNDVKTSSASLMIALIFAGSIMLTGCKQGRYEPAKWRPAIETDTLPTPSAVTANGTLPMRQSTLPRSSTLPRLTTLPRQSTLPQRSSERPTQTNRLVWDTSSKKKFFSPRTGAVDNMIYPPLRTGTLPMRGSNTLPMRASTLPRRMRSQLPDHMLPLRRQSTLPQRNYGDNRLSTLPSR